MGGYAPTTRGGHRLSEVASALQKAIRRADARLAGYWAVELLESNFGAYAWRRLLVISAEDCAGCVTFEIEALKRAWEEATAKRKGAGRIFAAKAVILLAAIAKTRDADHLTNLVVDARSGIDEGALLDSILEARKFPEAIPDYAYDCHTAEGKRRGKTKRDFFLDEHDALHPRQNGLFDADLEALRAGSVRLREKP